MELQNRRSNLASAQWANPAEFAQRHQFSEEDGHVWLGRSPLDGTPIGFSDDRHVCLIGGTRGGKGTSIILPNICSWPGSMVVVDPKGENATVAAARRGQGSDFCEGMGQNVHILDPFNVVSGQDAYKAHFNPLDALDPEHPEVIDRAAMIADALIVRDADSKEPYWQDSARAMVKTLILHVITWPHIEKERNLITLRELLTLGDEDGVESLKEMGHEDIPSAYRLLWKTVSNNTALNKVISGQASIFSQMLANSPREFGSILSTALINTEFLDSPGIRECLYRSDFELSDLKTKENGMSLFLSLPQRYMATHFRWLRMMVSLITAEMEIVRHQPRNGYPVMLMLDEFAGLERMKSIENAVAQIAGYGVKLFFVLQSLQQLKETYKEGWETFLANAGLKIFFGIGDNFSRDYISKMLGETEVYRDVQTSNEGSGSSRTLTEGESEGESESHGESTSYGKSTNHTEGESFSIARGTTESRGLTESQGHTKSKGGSSSRTTSRGGNKSHSRNSSLGRSSSYGFGGGGSQFGSSSNTGEGSSTGSTFSEGESRARNWTNGHTVNFGTSQNFGFSENRTRAQQSSVAHGETETVGTNRSRGTTRSRNKSKAIAESKNRTTGINQVLHHRPLITPDEIGLCLRVIKDTSMPQYPGLLLVVPTDERPTAVRRCNYFQDDQFIGSFDAHPDFPQSAPPSLATDVEIPWLNYPHADDHGNFPKVNFKDVKLKPHVSNESQVSAGELIATVGPVKYRSNKLTRYAEEFARHRDVEVKQGNRYHKVYAPTSGFLRLQPDQNRIGTIRTTTRSTARQNLLEVTDHDELAYDQFCQVIEKYNELKAKKTVGFLSLKKGSAAKLSRYTGKENNELSIELVGGRSFKKGDKIAQVVIKNHLPVGSLPEHYVIDILAPASGSRLTTKKDFCYTVEESEERLAELYFNSPVRGFDVFKQIERFFESSPVASEEAFLERHKLYTFGEFRSATRMQNHYVFLAPEHHQKIKGYQKIIDVTLNFSGDGRQDVELEILSPASGTFIEPGRYLDFDSMHPLVSILRSRPSFHYAILTDGESISRQDVNRVYRPIRELSSVKLLKNEYIGAFKDGMSGAPPIIGHAFVAAASLITATRIPEEIVRLKRDENHNKSMKLLEETSQCHFGFNADYRLEHFLTD